MFKDHYFAVLHPGKGLVGETDADGTVTFPNEDNPWDVDLGRTATRHTRDQAETFRDNDHPDCLVVHFVVSIHPLEE